MTAPQVHERVSIGAGRGLWQIIAAPGPVAVEAISCTTGARERLPLADIDRAEHRTGAWPALADLDPLAVVACGAAKLDHAAPARDLYTGQHFRLALAAAEAITPRVVILSARYGLLPLDAVAEPYEQRIDQPGAITADELRHQAAALDLRGARDVRVLAGAAYFHAARAVWPWARHELAGCPGIGYQRARLAQLARPAPLALF